MAISPLAGQPATAAPLIDVARLIDAYYSIHPNSGDAAQRVSFGTSGHRGTALNGSFNERHILAIAQAICAYRRQASIRGPLFIGIDTHALSEPAFMSALEVLAANGVELRIALARAASGLTDVEYTPTPAVSHAIIAYNRSKPAALADGIVITPSHNPPEDGGFKYNPPHGGPAASGITKFIEDLANSLLEAKLAGVRRVPFADALKAAATQRHDFIGEYVAGLGSVIDMDVIRASGIKMGVDPLGGAGVRYWGPIAERYQLNLEVVNQTVDPTFRFMTLDWDGKIRMDPSSPYAMRGLIALKDRFDIAFACDTDHDRHGIVAKSCGLLPPNEFLAVCISYLYAQRSAWPQGAAVGKTVVSSSMIDRVAAGMGRKVYEVPVGFKWFVEGLMTASLGFAGEESAGSSFLARDGAAWSTDKDGIIAALLSAEITARGGQDPGAVYAGLCGKYGRPVYERIDAPANAEQRATLAKLSAKDIPVTELAGNKIDSVLTNAPGDGNAIGGTKVITKDGWFAARPSGTEDVYKIYAESFQDRDHLQRIQKEAQAMIAQVLDRQPADQ
ncbi:MAG: phosphoglucomutase (alpha-D-glucose-1,6-bisphosphate-dependent) [Acidobacteriota bacterium]|nr:phosphoglucomutase (alpha-D-glucose-1,6-bisphosphate-dependent) [Acidobacteriota bacterium]